MIRENGTTIYESGDVLEFGSHKGETIDDVISEHPGWVEWALRDVEWFEISPELEARL